MRSLELARLLLDHGANPVATDTSSFTPLFYAVVNDSLDFVRLLLRYKVDLDQQIGAHHNLEHLPLPNTILHIAYRYEVKVAHLLLKHAHDEVATSNGIGRDRDRRTSITSRTKFHIKFS